MPAKLADVPQDVPEYCVFPCLLATARHHFLPVANSGGTVEGVKNSLLSSSTVTKRT
jgi:hypothetical protein